MEMGMGMGMVWHGMGMEPRVEWHASNMMQPAATTAAAAAATATVKHQECFAQKRRPRGNN